MKTDSTLWSAGDDLYGKLGYKTDVGNQLTLKKVANQIKLVRARGNNVMMINNKDEAWSFGGNANGVQGIGLKVKPRLTHTRSASKWRMFTQTISAHISKTNGTLWASGSNHQGQMGIAGPKESFRFTQVAEDVKGLTAEVSAGHTIVLKAGRYVELEVTGISN